MIGHRAGAGAGATLEALADILAGDLFDLLAEVCADCPIGNNYRHEVLMVYDKTIYLRSGK
jgi:hypothetical protein